MEKEVLYFDNAATTYPKPEKVYQEMDRVNRNLAVNAGRGSYKLAKEATKIIDDVRYKLEKLVNGTDNTNVVLTPSATIALNEIIGGLDWSSEDVCYVSPFEHNAVIRPLHLMKEKYGFQIIELPLDNENNYEIDIEKTEYLFANKQPTKLFMSHISNVTGYILPINKLALIAKKYNCITVVDASQSLGLLDIDMQNIDIDIVAFAGHKNMYGPFGIGGFFIKTSVHLNVYIAGGTGSDSLNPNMPESVPGKYEAASPNIIAVAGLNAALEVMDIDKQNDNTDYLQHEIHLTNILIDKLCKLKNVKVYASVSNHVGIVAFNIKSYKASDVGMILDEDYNIAVRTGYHCAPLIHKYLLDKEYAGVVRASVGRFTSIENVEAFAKAVKEISEEV